MYLFVAHLILLKQGTAHITIQRICEVIFQVLQSFVNIFSFLCVINAEHKQHDEPVERILVHGVNVSQISNREEQDGGVDGDGFVAHTG